jgi:inorganic pyrophosphatase
MTFYHGVRIRSIWRDRGSGLDVELPEGSQRVRRAARRLLFVAGIEVVIEISAGSFVKTAERDGKMVREFFSPLPSLFNYGYVASTRGEDGLPQDVVVLGRRLVRGCRLEAQTVGVVRFSDRGVRDDKLVATQDGRPVNRFERLLLVGFFSVYAAFKRLRYGGEDCRFEGLQTGSEGQYP